MSALQQQRAKRRYLKVGGFQLGWSSSSSWFIVNSDTDLICFVEMSQGIGWVSVYPGGATGSAVPTRGKLPPKFQSVLVIKFVLLNILAHRSQGLERLSCSAYPIRKVPKIASFWMIFSKPRDLKAGSFLINEVGRPKSPTLEENSEPYS